MEPNVWTPCSSASNCVEVKWLSACSSGGCVEVSHQDDKVLVRDSKLGEESPVIEYDREEWQLEVLEEIKEGGWLPGYSYRKAGATTVMRRWPVGGVELHFTEEEWDAFVKGVRGGVFDLQVTS